MAAKSYWFSTHAGTLDTIAAEINALSAGGTTLISSWYESVAVEGKTVTSAVVVCLWQS